MRPPPRHHRRPWPAHLAAATLLALTIATAAAPLAVPLTAARAPARALASGAALPLDGGVREAG
jgi:hypothetical protein